MKDTIEILKAAKAAAPQIGLLSTAEKNEALMSMADALMEAEAEILAANRADIAAASDTIGAVMVDRLYLDHKRLYAMAEGIRAVAALPDPIGQVLETKTCENGLTIQKVSVPMGVIAMIYESRPNVTSDAAALSFKAGSACVLRSGKEAIGSAMAIVHALKKGLGRCSLPEEAIALVENTDRQSATLLMKSPEYVDLLIPRGGAGLIRACVENATVPCIQTGTGICHIYVDRDADIEMALNIVENAKMSRPSVCNAAEVCLVHHDIAAEFLPRLAERLCNPEREHPAKLIVDAAAGEIINGISAKSGDFDTEFLDYILAVAVVKDVRQAVEHIARHSTHHSEAIITRNAATARYFSAAVDSAAVYINASTRFTDGGEFGLGCEIGISTQKLHARGPMGLREITTYKYIVTGNGQIR